MFGAEMEGGEEVVVEEPSNGVEEAHSEERSAAEAVLGRSIVKRGPRGISPEKQAKIRELAAQGLNAAQITSRFVESGDRVVYATVRKYMGDPMPSHTGRGRPAKAKPAVKVAAKVKAKPGPKPGRRPGRPRATNGSANASAGIFQILLLAKQQGHSLADVRAVCDLIEGFSK